MSDSFPDGYRVAEDPSVSNQLYSDDTQIAALLSIFTDFMGLNFH